MTSGFEIFENVVEIHQEVQDEDLSSKEEKMIEYCREIAQIEDQDILQIDRQLHWQRLVQTELLTQFGHVFGGR